MQPGRVVSQGLLIRMPIFKPPFTSFPNRKIFCAGMALQPFARVCIPVTSHINRSVCPVTKGDANVVFFAGLNWTRKKVIGLGNKPASPMQNWIHENLVRASMKQGQWDCRRA